MNSAKLRSFLAVSGVIGIQFSSHTYYLAKVFHTKYPAWATFLLVLLSVLTGMIFWTYSYSVFRDPGFIPLSKEDDLDNPEFEERKDKARKLRERVSICFFTFSELILKTDASN